MLRYGMLVPLALGAIVSAACGEESDAGGDGDTSAGDGDGDINLGDGDGDGDVVDGMVDGCEDTYSDTNGCVGETFEGENIPLDIYIMFDQSLSMGCQIEASQPWSDWCCGDECDMRIDPVRAAVDQFLTDPRSNGIWAGIGFFGHMQVGTTSCDEGEYSSAAVEMGQLPSNADPVLEALYGVSPTGETPTGAAIRGACNYVNAWHEEQPGHKKVILLVTDGVPEAPSTEACVPTLDDAVAAATECLEGDLSVETYVLGVGQALDNLGQIAAAGGTEQAYLVDEDVETSVLEALNAIRADAVIPCTLPIPAPSGGGTINYSQVNIGICDAAEETLYTYHVEVPDDCDLGGWYYEDTDDGRVIQLCDATCDTVSVAGATLFFSVGCETVVTPVR